MTDIEYTPKPKRSRRAPIIIAGTIVLALLIAGGAILYAIQTSKTVNKQDREITRRLSIDQIRACIRNNILSATFVYSVQRATNRTTPKERRQNKSLVEHLYPVLACERSRITGRSITLVPEEKQKYVDIVAKGRAPIVSDDGRVIGSRKTVLEGITTVEKTGSQVGDQPVPPQR